MPFSDLYTVTVEHRTVTQDSRGNDVESYGPPTTYPVYGWGPPAADAELRDEFTGLERRLTVYASTGFTGPRDLVTVGGTVYRAVGNPMDWNHGPFGWKPGFQINLEMEEG
jgi:hypothetical protein